MMIRFGYLLGWLVAWGGVVAAGDEPKPPDPALAERFAAIKAEFAAQQEVTRQATAQAKNDREEMELYEKLTPDDVVYSRRMVNLALEGPTDPAARDACVWVIYKLYRADAGAYGDEFARAAALLVRHHGDDPIAVSAGLNLEHAPSPRRDAFLFGLLAAAKNHEAQGIARLALARYLETKVSFVLSARKHPGRQTHLVHGMMGDDGKPVDKPVEQGDESYAYHLSNALADPDAVRAEAERLYHEVISDFGDVPLTSTPHRRNLEATLREPTPMRNGQPLTAAQIDQIRRTLARVSTLGSLAENFLDEMHNITPGKPAPDIDGVTLDGQPLKLTDYRGKVVVLVFWGSWCGPCIREFPSDRDLVAKYQGRPFALLGVDCKDTREAAQQVIAAEHVTWPNFYDGDGQDGDGPIGKSYHIRGYPSSFVIDAQGIIRHKHLIGPALDAAVAKLIDEVQSPASP